jgi:hypothetical protein
VGVCEYGTRSLAVTQWQQDFARSVSCRSFDSTPTTALHRLGDDMAFGYEEELKAEIDRLRRTHD